ncbi:HEPN domain-containing protein [Acididesulfobacillus acetoxydans]|uniref:HEPN domain-containing protein n=1 Tax=Acididesulfobacillus acetoxydans TaxID=1561005 RepID=UPI0035574A71
MSTNNWLEFALDDLDGGEILLRENKYNMACFHAQQAAEKSLKGFLTGQPPNFRALLPYSRDFIVL